jgi:ligand-binding sensor domain-containing protein
LAAIILLALFLNIWFMKQLIILTLLNLLLCHTIDSQCLDDNCECVYSIAVDEDTIWIGTKIGLYKYNIQTKENLLINNRNSQLPSNYVYSLKLGKDNSLWIGTYGGILANLKNGKWKLLNTTISKLVSKEILSIEIFKDSIIWLATDKGIITYDTKNWGYYNKENSSLTYDLVFSLENEGDSIMWASAYGGLSKYNGKWKQYNRSNSGIPHSTVYSTTVVGQSKYVCTEGGLASFNGYGWDIEFNDKTLVFRYDTIGRNYWAGTSNGVKRYIIDWDTSYNTTNSILTDNYITALEIDKYGNIWIGTWGGGLYCIENKKWRKLDLNTGIEPNEKDKEILVYPNPSSGFLNIKFDILTKNKLIEIHNIEGNLLLLKRLNSVDGLFRLDIRSLNSGFYILDIIFDNKKITKKIIVNNYCSQQRL